MVTRYSETDRSGLVVGACLVLALLIVLLFAGMARAQTAPVPNPRYVSFVVSPEHNQVVDGTPIVSSYELRLFARGATQAVTSSDLGKPTAANGARVEFDRAATFLAVPLGEYEARVVAIGPGGEGASAAVPFGRVSAPGAPTSAALGR